MSETEILGIDFSGSKSPGRKIWITKGTVSGDALQIEESQSARDAFDERGREAILGELREKCQSNAGAVIGFDFPFGFPTGSVETDEWTEFLEEFADEFKGGSIGKYPGNFKTEKQLRREVDYRYAGQSPMSPQVQYQVFYGLRDLLHPLVCEQESVRVCPMQSPKEGLPTLIEVYPAATLGRLGCYRTGYKNTPGARERRKDTVEALEERGIVDLHETDTEQFIRSDDALDSLVAAVAAHRAVQKGLEEDLDSEVEGHIYT